MKNGSMTRAFVFYEGKEIELRLAMVELSGPFIGEKKRELRFVSGVSKVNPKVVIRTFYSGGETGAGMDSHTLARLMTNTNIRSYDTEECKVITRDLEEIVELQKLYEIEIEQEKQKHYKEQKAKAARINLLPQEFNIEGFPELVIHRGAAKFDPASSHRIVQYTTIKETEGSIGHRAFRLDNYITVDGKVRRAKFAGEMRMYFGDRSSKIKPKEALLKIKQSYDDIVRLVGSVK